MRLPHENFRKKRSVASVYNHLFEGLFDDPAGGGDEGGGGEAAGGGDEAGGGEEAGGGDEGGGEGEDKKEEDKKEEEKKEPEIKLTAEDEATLGDSIDEELDTMFVDFETKARKAAAIDIKRFKNESYRRQYSIKRILSEVAAADIDLRIFAREVARLIKNYDTLIDMKSIIMNKAFAYIKVKYGDDTEKALKDVLEQDFKLSTGKDAGYEDEDEPEVPIAVGARTAAG